MRIRLILTLALVLLSSCKSPKDGTCGKDSDCKEGVCVFSKCQECAVNTDCKDGKVCENNQCIVAPVVSVPENLTPASTASVCSDTGTVHFDFNQYEIKAADRDMLTEIATCLRTKPDSKITVSGNTDERGTVEYNLALGEKRAKAVSQYLQNSGINDSRMHVVSYGKEKPVDPEHNEEAWAKNRRTDITAE
ncbi:MAG: peptidoglycan-associated lipoprotein Pal [Myxococcaceae bacterium]